MSAAPPVIVNSKATRVHRTAESELRRMLMRAAVPSLNRICLATLDESSQARQVWTAHGLALDSPTRNDDAFAVVRQGDSVTIAGVTPRAMLQGVFELDDAVALGRAIDDGLVATGRFRFERRIFHQRIDRWPGSRDDVRYIARLGASHCLYCHDWQGEARHLHGFVQSPIFPDAIDRVLVQTQHAHLARLIEDCADYALEPAAWITELPCQGGPWVPQPEREAFLSRFPAEVLSESGTYQGKVLCFGHPRVREFYRDVMRRYFQQFPSVGLVFVFNIDSGGEFCDPTRCPRCAGVSKIEQRDRFLRFLVEEGRLVRSGLEVLTTGWGWDRDVDDFLRRQDALPAGCGLFLAAQRDGWQPERQTHDVLREARAICRRRAQAFIGYDNIHWGDDTVHFIGDIQDYPLGIAAKLKRWQAIGADGVFDHWGTWSQDVSSNSVAFRALMLEPLADEHEIVARIASEQFGGRAAPAVIEAWTALDAAHAVLSEACTWSPLQWPGWYRGRSVVSFPSGLESGREALISSAESAKPAGARVYNGGTLADRCAAVAQAWRAACPHYASAVDAMRRAVVAADGAPIGYAHWWSGPEPVPTRREHLCRQLRYIESMQTIGAEIGLHFELQACWERTRPDERAFRVEAASLLTDIASACDAAEAFVNSLGEAAPQVIRAWAHQYRAKAIAARAAAQQAGT